MSKVLNNFSMNPSPNLSIPPSCKQLIDCIYFWKAEDLTYAGGNQFALDALGAVNVSEIQGKTDYDFWGDCEITNKMRKQDLAILNGEYVINRRELRIINNVPKLLNINKIPLMGENEKIIGILGFHYAIDCEKNEIEYRDKPSLDTGNKEVLCKLANEKLNNVLKMKEVECLALWLNGYSIKESAACLYLSYKTIEAYRSVIKEKLGLYHRGQIIDLTHQNNTFYLFFSITKIIIKNKK